MGENTANNNLRVLNIMNDHLLINKTGELQYPHPKLLEYGYQYNIAVNLEMRRQKKVIGLQFT